MRGKVEVGGGAECEVSDKVFRDDNDEFDGESRKDLAE